MPGRVSESSARDNAQIEILVETAESKESEKLINCNSFLKCSLKASNACHVGSRRIICFELNGSLV